MYLTKEQEEILNGRFGWAAAKALEIIVKVGEFLGADSLVKISHAHVSGISYSNIGKHGLELIHEFFRKGGKARVFTTINPGCLDYSGYSQVIDDAYRTEQGLIDEALSGMGFKPIYTCIPYYYRPPVAREHLAWGESSAVIFANSIYGAKTNREGGPLALASALTGYTYRAGLHLDENRVVRVRVVVHPEVNPSLYGAVGLWIGEFVKKTPVLLNTPKVVVHRLGDVKNALASSAASGNHALVVVEGLTPRNTYMADIEENIEITLDSIDEYLANPPPPERGLVLGYLGCPHTLPEELLEVVRLLRRYGPVKRGRLLITIPREFASKYWFLVKEAKSLGADIAAGTCPVVSKLRGRFDYVLTNSGKAYFYLRRVHGLRVGLTSVKEVVEYVCGRR